MASDEGPDDWYIRKTWPRELSIHRRRIQLDQRLKNAGFAIEDPLVQVFADDRVIRELGSDPDKVFMGYMQTQIWSRLQCPLYLLCDLMFGCTGLLGMCAIRNLLRDSTRAVRLTLRENTLVYTSDKGEIPNQMPGHLIVLWEVFKEKLVNSVELVFPLDEDIHLELLPPLSASICRCCKTTYPVDTLVLRVGNDVIGSIDGPKDAKAFIEAVERQKAEVTSKRPSSRASQNALDVHKAVVRYLVGISGTDKFWENLYHARLKELSGTGWQERCQQMNSRVSATSPGNIAWHSAAMKEEYYLLTRRLPHVMDTTPMQSAPLADDMVRDHAVKSTGTARINRPVNRSLRQLTTADVSSLLAESGLGEYCVRFEEAHIDGTMLDIIDEDTLKELGVSSALVRKQILAWIIRMKSDNEELVAELIE